MKWEAANIKRRQVHRDDPSQQDGGVDTTPTRKRRSVETAEAALARLTKSYSTAMTCVGALHRASNALYESKIKTNPPGLQNNSNTIIQESASTGGTLTQDSDHHDDPMSKLQRVASAARTTLENAVLLDPLIVSHAPTFHKTIMYLAQHQQKAAACSTKDDVDVDNDRWTVVLEAKHRPTPPVLTSKAHRSTIRDLAYLSLVNYADLLLVACDCSKHKKGSTFTSILDRGVTQKLKAMDIIVNREDRGKKCCCWTGEDQEVTQRLALVALCDASELDGTDPSLWLKLACAARGLGRINAVTFQGSSEGKEDTEEAVATGLCQYRRLERHALERGYSALPDGVPPNRTIVRALSELDDMESTDIYPAKLVQSSLDENVAELVLDLPRYSWSVLGRMIMRACREGAAYRFELMPHLQLSSDNAAKQGVQNMFGSPRLSLRISPILALPSYVLGTICQYLDAVSVWKFEATCRALSVSVVSARALVEQLHQNSAALARKNDRQQESNLDLSKNETEDSKRHAEGEIEKDESAVDNNDAAGQTDAKKKAKPARSHRSSKRVLSQMMMSCRMAERRSRRNSVEFCFLASVLSCTADDEEYLKLLKIPIVWENSLKNIQSEYLLLGSGSSSIQASARSSATELQARQQNEARERCGDAALTVFADRCSGHNSAPYEVLSRFLIHIAMNVEDVFSGSSEDTMVLTSCFTDCVDLLAKRKGFSETLVPSWFGNDPDWDDCGRGVDMETFAVNLLYAELRLRRCERHSVGSHDYEDDGNALSMLLPVMVRLIEPIDDEFDRKIDKPQLKVDEMVWTGLKTRCHWLAAGFYFWRNKISQNILEARQAESLGLNHIEKCLECLKMPEEKPIRIVRTPHLGSLVRTEIHWKELSESILSKYRDNIEAASVISLARQSFLEVIETEGIEGGNSEHVEEFSQDDIVSLDSTGKDLFCRYDTKYEGLNGKHGELLDDFLVAHGEDLLLSSQSIDDEQNQTDMALTNLWNLIPSRRPERCHYSGLPNPSILTILISCMQAQGENKLSVLLLLTRLVHAAYDQLGFLVRQKKDEGKEEDGFVENSGNESDSFSDSDDSYDSDDDIGADNHSKKDDTSTTDKQIIMVQLLLCKITDICTNSLSAQEKKDFSTCNEFGSLMYTSFGFAADWHEDNMRRTFNLSPPADLRIFLAIRSLYESMLNDIGEESRQHLYSTYFVGVTRILISQRKLFPALLRSHGDNRTGRSLRQKNCRKRSEYIGAIANEMANLLSQNLSKLYEKKLLPSYLLDALHWASASDHGESTGDTHESDSAIAVLCESIIWFWKYIMNSEDPNLAKNSFDRPIANQLRVPIASVVIGLCGAAAPYDLFTSKRKQSEDSNIHEEFRDDQVCLAEFFDSDDSAHDWRSDDEDSESLGCALLRVLCQSVHCVALVFNGVKEKDAVTSSPHSSSNNINGPTLPLVTARVLNHFSVVLLTEFGQSDATKWKNLWDVKYPICTRTTGNLLDSMLHKAYRFLHGFTLVGANNANDHATPPGHVEDNDQQKYPPESTSAAAGLYRCIIRAYSTSRKSPPKAALECVANSLPPVEESDKSRVICNFLFSTKSDNFSPKDVIKLVSKSSNSALLFSNLPEWFWKDEGDDSDYSGLEEVTIVRRGVYRELAKGSFPVKIDVTSKSDDSNESLERLSSSRYEEDLSKRLAAILKDLCYGNSLNYESWYNAAQCLTLRADHIVDRLGQSRGFGQSDSITIPENYSAERLNSPKDLKLADLIKSQERDYNNKTCAWIPYLGSDLNIYNIYQWTSFKSLVNFSDAISKNLKEQALPEEVAEDKFHYVVYKEIESKYENGDLAGWQEAWGGIFVGALRCMSIRCLCMSLYLLLVKRDSKAPNNSEVSELSESLGVMHYARLAGSQMYGYPMHIMTPFKKRLLAETALVCFKRAVDASSNSGKASDDEGEVTWDLTFMIGKCYEKISSTYKRECFTTSGESSKLIRRYEHYMNEALRSYAEALKEATNLEIEGDSRPEVKAGGSTHGSTEVLYRLHASRFKCMLYAVRRQVDRAYAEEEAYRLTSQHWYNTSVDEEIKKIEREQNIRGKVWNVLVDTVAALAQCRLEKSYFHRSVYRFVQALCWAPVFLHPDDVKNNTSLATVPATKSHYVRGLNHATPCVNSGEVIMAKLFERKRPQLCSVWVTTPGTAPSPFEAINNSIRKFDCLRSKYVEGYVECLRLCKRTEKLEMLLEWVRTSNRDLPSFYQASALAKGGEPKNPHTNDCLLLKKPSIENLGLIRSVKRKINSAIADVVIQELQTSKKSGSQVSQIKVKEYLKLSFTSYLQLNCTIRDLERSRAWKYGLGSIREVEALCESYLALQDHEHVHMKEQNWSGGAQKKVVLEAALQKAHEVFPNILSKKKSRKRTKTDAKVDESKKKPFIVEVPSGLSKGDSFQATIRHKGFVKKVRLTVPEGNPTRLKFSLTFPTPTKSQKRPKHND